MSPFDAGVELNENLLSILGNKPGDYGKPKDVFKEMVIRLRKKLVKA